MAELLGRGKCIATKLHPTSGGMHLTPATAKAKRDLKGNGRKLAAQSGHQSWHAPQTPTDLGLQMPIFTS